jgi:hypothetical protein
MEATELLTQHTVSASARTLSQLILFATHNAEQHLYRLLLRVTALLKSTTQSQTKLPILRKYFAF